MLEEMRGGILAQKLIPPDWLLKPEVTSPFITHLDSKELGDFHRPL